MSHRVFVVNKSFFGCNRDLDIREAFDYIEQSINKSKEDLDQTFKRLQRENWKDREMKGVIGDAIQTNQQLD